MSLARILAVISKDDPYAAGYREALEHLGLRVEYFDAISANDLNRAHVLLLCGRGRIKDTERSGLTVWLNHGGQIVLGGSTWGIGDVVGFVGTDYHLSVGTAMGEGEDRLWPEGVEEIKFFGANATTCAKGKPLATARSKAVLARSKVGRGKVIFCGLHVGQSLVQGQMGRAVEVDGIGPEDSTVVLDNGMLSADDGIGYGWHLRENVEGVPTFMHPHSDLVREVWYRAIFEAVEDCGHTVVLPWFWPDNADFVAAVTLECQSFEVEPTISIQRTLAMYGIPAAWTVAFPGYGSDVYRAMRARGHEIGLLFTLDDVNPWHDERLRSQFTQITRLSGDVGMVTSRPADGAWKGLTRFYEMCDSAGVRLAITKGGQQAGDQGFAFGTCHPFHPVRSDGTLYHTLELPFQVFSPGRIASVEQAKLLAEAAKRRHGCVHILCQPEDFSSQGSSLAVRNALSHVKDLHPVWKTPGEIYRFEKGRRQVRMTVRTIGGDIEMSLTSEISMDGFTLLMSAAPKNASVNGKPLRIVAVERFGLKLYALNWDLQSHSANEVRAQLSYSEAA